MKTRLLIVFFAIALACNGAYLVSGLVSIPAYYQRVTTQTIEPYVIGLTPTLNTDTVAREAVERGLSLQGYALLQIAVTTLVALALTGTAVLIVWRAWRQWYAWYTAFVFVFLAGYVLRDVTIVARLLPSQVLAVSPIFWFLLIPYFYFFPDGLAVPQRSLWLVGPLVVYHMLLQAIIVISYFRVDNLGGVGTINWRTGQGFVILPVLLNFLIVLICQVYRYARVSTPTQRQQMKWFLFGFGLMGVAFSVGFITRGQGGLVDDLIATAVAFLALPITLAIAILRYRLWDIDVIIRKTLVYTVLTALIALIYFGGVVLVQQLTRSITASSDLAIAVSTLIIAALFFPLRRRVQNAIDRRFYRRKYDAAKTLAAFGVTVRDEVELEKLTAELINVVNETMQPASVSLWLKAEKGGKSAHGKSSKSLIDHCLCHTAAGECRAFAGGICQHPTLLRARDYTDHPTS